MRDVPSLRTDTLEGWRLHHGRPRGARSELGHGHHEPTTDPRRDV